MIAAIREMAEKNALGETHTLTADYLTACSMIFENGILSHQKITSINSKPLTNITEGMKWFLKWKEELQEEPGNVEVYST